MIRLERANAWYRPYHYDKYTIKDIVIYDENGVIVNANCGWLETSNKQDLQYIELNIDDLLLKRKEDFSIKGAFIISKGKDFVGELQATLYIHKDIVKLECIGYKKIYDSIRKYYKGYTSDNQDFEISMFMEYLKDDYYKQKDELKEVLKTFEDNIEEFNFSGNRSEFIEQIQNFIKDIKKTSNKLLDEQKKLAEYSVEDYLKEIGEGK